MSHKSGFISIIGKPNVGKSTLMNRMLKEKLSIVTPKAQTTRHRIKGILNSENYQVVFSDTPGILEPHYLLHNKMMEFVESALEDADAVLFITDLEEAYMDQQLVARIQRIKVPVIIVLNKVDLSSTNEINKLVHGWKKAVNPSSIIPASALTDFNLDKILETVLEIIPEAPAYFDKGNLSDSSQRFFASEMIREKIFMHYGKEIPYSSDVGIEEFKEEKSILRIRAIIYVERNSQKGIIIGRGGEGLKRIGTESRKDMEKLFGKKVFLEIFVKVEENWRKRENVLKRFGYGFRS
jgi:GTP-binding protein Era